MTDLNLTLHYDSKTGKTYLSDPRVLGYSSVQSLSPTAVHGLQCEVRPSTGALHLATSHPIDSVVVRQDGTVFYPSMWRLSETTWLVGVDPGFTYTVTALFFNASTTGKVWMKVSQEGDLEVPASPAHYAPEDIDD